MVSLQVSIRSNDEYSSTLIIDHLQFHHRGNYTCTASNAAGSSKHTAELIVNGRIFFDRITSRGTSENLMTKIRDPSLFFPVPPKWVDEPQDVEAVEGQDVILPCAVEGFPEPTSAWTKDTGFGVSTSYQLQPLGLEDNQFPNGSLLIPGATKRSEGIYTCTAKNGVRSSISKSINVTVNGKKTPENKERVEKLPVRS